MVWLSQNAIEANNRSIRRSRQNTANFYDLIPPHQPDSRAFDNTDHARRIVNFVKHVCLDPGSLNQGQDLSVP
jgi:hypothetical protein